ncbi:hypothetical protein BV898_07797 [Hypsibius exemplaris]|uniref:Uncharacterized protein n=1 Tax=Hypsibius exemplaris TaxID=2072580 RepID=A0A1W0WSM3_HYPEX|nr:hypothetical protein BV898_07797 [Hypsibius exemplaris]
MSWTSVDLRGKTYFPFASSINRGTTALARVAEFAAETHTLHTQTDTDTQHAPDLSFPPHSHQFSFTKTWTFGPRRLSDWPVAV